MARSPRLGAVFVLAALVPAAAVTACGSDAEPDGAAGFPPAASDTAATLPPTVASDPAATSTAVASSAPATTPSVPPTDRPNLAEVRLALTEIGTFDEPVALVDRGGTLYVAEKGGRVLALTGSEPLEVLDMTDLTESAGEQGLLGLAFSPDGTLLYVSYTNNDGDSRVDEYAMGAGLRARPTPPPGARCSPSTSPTATTTAATSLFGPDGLLYLGYGDGGSAGDPERHGLRTPARCSASCCASIPGPAATGPTRSPPTTRSPTAPPRSRRSGAPGCATRGASRSIRPPATSGSATWARTRSRRSTWSPAAQGAGRGTNFGWSAFEGTDRYNDDQESPNHWPPIYEYRHADGGCSVTGGVVYRGDGHPGAPRRVPVRRLLRHGDQRAGGRRRSAR